MRPAWAEVDVAAVRANAATLAAVARPAELCAVVKADAYGHGAVPVARAALEGGATWLAVAIVEEGEELRAAGIGAPVLLLSEPPPDCFPAVVAADLRPAVYTPEGIEAAAKAVVDAGRPSPLPVHLKVDTGMHRVGAAPADVPALAAAVVARPELALEAVWTHLAVAEAAGDPFTAAQLDRLDAVLAGLGAAGIRPPLVHAANSAGTLLHPRARRHLARCGLALYGVLPGAGLAAPGAGDLRPALSLRARVSLVKEVPAGDGISYGLHRRFDRPTVVATVPIGYHDGVPRRYGLTGGEVLIGGRRRPVAGVVTMDQLTVDCGDDRSVRPGDEVVLLGGQGGERIDAWEWAGRLGLIAWEVLCGIGPRVPRRYVDR